MTAAYYISSPSSIDCRNRFLVNTFILHRDIIVLCTTHMMACSVVTSHVTTILCHSGAELFDNDLYSALS